MREAFEEAGLLLARRNDQADMVSLDGPEAARLIDGLHPEAGPERSSTPSWRELIDSGSANMAQLCVAEDLVLAMRAAGQSRMPGERRYRQRAQSDREGIVLDAATWQRLQELAGAA